MNKYAFRIAFFLKAILFLTIFFSINIFVLSIYYKINYENIEKYIPSDFSGYLKIDSLFEFYEKISGLRANDIILSNEKIEALNKTIKEISSKKYLKNKTLQSLLNTKVNIILKKDYSPILCFDLGFKSILFNATNFMSKYFSKNDYFLIKAIKNNSKEYNLYRIFFYQSNQTLYFSINKNLLFVSFNLEDFNYIYNVKKNKKNIYYDADFRMVKNKSKTSGVGEIYFKTNELLKPLVRRNNKINLFLSKCNFDLNSALSFDIENNNLYFSTYSRYKPTDIKINDFNWKDPKSLDIIKVLPDDTNIFLNIFFKSFEEFNKLAIYFKNGNYENTINGITNLLASKFGTGINEMLYSWIGDEAGFFSTKASAEPVVYVKVKNKNKLNDIINSLTKINVINKNLKLNDNRISRIYFPDFLAKEMNIYFENFNGAYYSVLNDFIFFSKDYKVLISLLNKQNDQKILKDVKSFKDIYGRIRSRANINFYFNLKEGLPEFLQNGSFISDLIKLYEKGIFAINIENNNLTVDFAASGINVRKVSIYPGFPKKTNYTITTPIICEDLTGSQNYGLIYGTSNNKLEMINSDNENLNGFPIYMDGVIKGNLIVTDLDKDGKKEIFALTDNGFFHRIDLTGNESNPFPVKLNFKSLYNPVLLNDKFLFYSKNDKKLLMLDNDNFKESKIILQDYLQSQIVINSNFILYNAKNSNGSVYLIDLNGNVMENWPKDAGGVGAGSPVVGKIGYDNKQVIIFLTQNGLLNIWKSDGAGKNGFPVQLPGTYNRQPEIGYFDRDENKKIITINDDGLLIILSDKGEIIKERKIKELSSHNNQILLFDVNRDGLSEIFIYGSNNLIYALDSKLNLLPGFPVKGNTKPSFCDLNSDGEYEMITGGLDNYLYIYSIPRF